MRNIMVCALLTGVQGQMQVCTEQASLLQRLTSRGVSNITQAECGGNDTSESLPRYTPRQSDWRPTCVAVADHTPPLSVAWDQTTIYNPVTSLNFDKVKNPGGDESVFYDQMCPNGMLRGLSQLFDDERPFANNFNPTKAEVDHWNGIVLTHIRKLVGIDHPATPDVCLMARALWANQWRHTEIWKPADAANPDQYVCPKTGSDAHCGASFVPKTQKKQAPYLPQGHSMCFAGNSAEGAFGHSPNTPWSVKTAEIFCNTLKSEGYWGGHTGPFFSREKFGFGFWHEGSARFKWGGINKASIYIDPRVDLKTKLDGFHAACQKDRCDGLDWKMGNATHAKVDTTPKFDTAQQCREYVLDNPKCSNAFVTYSTRDGGCGCYPPEKKECGEVTGQSYINTFFLTPVDSGSKHLGIAGPPYHAWNRMCEVKSVNLPKWAVDRQCGNATDIKWIDRACNPHMCLETILANPECDHKYMLFNTNARYEDENCACYLPGQPENFDKKKDCTQISGRKLYDIVDGCSGIAGENAQLDQCGVCNGTNACFESSSPEAGAGGTGACPFSQVPEVCKKKKCRKCENLKRRKKKRCCKKCKHCEACREFGR